jgi:ABC-type uncharacterized transport system permease subunit
MPILWLRVALGFYALGLIYALVSLSRRDGLLNRIALPAMALGMVFQFVSLTEDILISGQLTLTSVHNAESMLSLLIMAGFLIVYLVYRTSSPGIVVFPLVFLLTLTAASGQQPILQISPVMAKGWLFAHITLIFIGYAALFLSFSASVLYLIQERSLKSKSPGVLSRLPALEVMDKVGYQSLLIGFPCMTIGLILGIVLAQATYHKIDFLDPIFFLSIMMWFVYLLLVYTRWNAGWRGRRVAYLAAGAFVVAVLAWCANYFSTIHRLVRS